MAQKLVVSKMWIFLGEARQSDILPCAVCSGGDRRLRVGEERSVTLSQTIHLGLLRHEDMLRHGEKLRHGE